MEYLKEAAEKVRETTEKTLKTVDEGISTASDGLKAGTATATVEAQKAYSRAQVTGFGRNSCASIPIMQQRTNLQLVADAELLGDWGRALQSD